MFRRIIKLPKQTLKKEYLENKLTQEEIAKKYKISRITVYRWMNKYDIPIRSEREAQYRLRKNHSKSLYQNYNWLYDKYVIKKWTAVKVAKFCGCGRSTVLRWLKKFNIKARTNSEAHKNLKRSLESRIKQSKTVSGKGNPMFGKPCPTKSSNYKWYKYKNHNFQGSYELAFAKWLDKNKIKWISHKGIKRFLYFDDRGNKRTYGPDFYLPEHNLYIEIKGYFRPGCKRKMQIVKEMYPGYKILLIIKKDLEQIGVI